MAEENRETQEEQIDPERFVSLNLEEQAQQLARWGTDVDPFYLLYNPEAFRGEPEEIAAALKDLRILDPESMRQLDEYEKGEFDDEIAVGLSEVALAKAEAVLEQGNLTLKQKNNLEKFKDKVLDVAGRIIARTGGKNALAATAGIGLILTAAGAARIPDINRLPTTETPVAFETYTPPAPSEPTEIATPVPTNTPGSSETVVPTTTETDARDELRHESITPTATEVQVLISNGEVLARVDTEKPVFALTIDDGYSKEDMEKILKILNDKGVHATFFLIGYAAKYDLGEDLVKQIALSGNEIGYHTVNHEDVKVLKNWSEATWDSDYKEWTETMKTLLGEDLYNQAVKPYARPPGGLFNEGFLEMCRKKTFFLSIGIRIREIGRVEWVQEMEIFYFFM